MSKEDLQDKAEQLHDDISDICNGENLLAVVIACNAVMAEAIAEMEAEQQISAIEDSRLWIDDLETELNINLH